MKITLDLTAAQMDALRIAVRDAAIQAPNDAKPALFAVYDQIARGLGINQYAPTKLHGQHDIDPRDRQPANVRADNIRASRGE